jgi:branched-chain amino acid transport system ATP-binding protein
MTTSALRIQNLTKRFGGIIAVENVSLELERGMIHGLIGPNGAGKSTMIGLISGLIARDEGTIALGDRDLTRLDPASIARLGISRTFQHATPFPGLTATENVMLGMHMLYRRNVLSVLFRTPAMRGEARQIEASTKKLLAELDLSQDADADAASLPFGKLRFIELARAIAMGPTYLLLDEPAAGLNQHETERLAKLVRELAASGVGVLLVDHDVPFVFGTCHRVTVMDFGSIIASGIPDEIYNNPAVRDAYLGMPEKAEGSE